MYDDRGNGISISPRLIIAVVIVGFSLVSYFGHSVKNPVTGRTQHISISAEDEVAIGLQSAPAMAQQFGGESSNFSERALVQKVGERVVANLPSEAPKYPFEFHLLADSKTINAFALPGGQVFITQGLLSKLDTEGELAGVLGHETGHVIARHSAQQMAKGNLLSGLVGAAGVASTHGYASQQAAAAVGQFVLLKYGRDDELEADKLGLRFMAAAGYDPNSMIDVMKILDKVSSGSSQPDFLSTHPNPGNRIEHIQADLKELFPHGVSEGLKK